MYTFQLCVIFGCGVLRGMCVLVVCACANVRACALGAWYVRELVWVLAGVCRALSDLCS